MIDIANKWALVTGSSRGVGLRVAGALAGERCKLILHARERSHNADLLAELHAAGHEVHSVAADLASISELDRLIGEVREITGGRLDILYNNAAVMTPSRPLFEVPADEYRLSFMVNSIAPAKLCDAFLPAMLEQDWGRIVNVTSGIADQPELLPYSCSKAALDRYVRDMLPTLEGTNVLMNLLDPGWLRTDLGGPDAPNDPDRVIPGALVPVLLDRSEGSGRLYKAMAYAH